MPSFAFLSDPLFPVVAATAFAAALVRGFSGFGAGLILLPVAAMAFGPKVAVGLFFVVDTLLTVPMVVRAVPAAQWREILPLAAGAVLFVPVGAAVLVHADAAILRWAMSGLILASVALLATGIRYRGPTRIGLSVGVGAVAGFLGGVAQMTGPPVILYWLGRDVVPATMRANAIVFFCFTTAASGVAYWIGGIFTAEVMARSAAILPVYAIGLAIGSRMFGWASEATARRVAYGMIVLTAVLTLPVFG